MTIALAIKANNGIVVAADTKESYVAADTDAAEQKVSENKIRVYESPDRDGACAISGAGTGGAIDALSDRLGAVFKKHPARTAEALMARFGHAVKRYHLEHIASSASLPQPPQAYMVIGVVSRAIPEGAIFSTDNDGTITQRQHYAAVGHGTATAKRILNKYRVADQIQQTAVMAVFAVYRTKRVDDYCGMDTTVTLLHGPTLRASDGFSGPNYGWPAEWHSAMPAKEIRGLETYFMERYEHKERRLLYRTIDRLVARAMERQRRRQSR